MSDDPTYEVDDRIWCLGETGTIKMIEGRDHYIVAIDGRGFHLLHASHFSKLED